MKIDGFASPSMEGWNELTGLPTAAHFGNAVQVWSIAQDRSTTVQEAAVAFNVDAALIRAAVEAHYWMFLDGDTIEHEGE